MNRPGFLTTEDTENTETDRSKGIVRIRIRAHSVPASVSSVFSAVNLPDCEVKGCEQ